MNNKKLFTIAIVENEEKYRSIVREELGHIEQYSLIFFVSAEDFLRNANPKDYDLIYVDINLVDMDGIELVDRISSKSSDLKIVMLTGVGSDQQIFSALRKGAIGYLLKTDFFKLSSITEIFLNNGSFMSATIAFIIQKSFKIKKEDSLIESLTDREKQIVELIMKGYTAEQVSDQFAISIHTVRNHIRNIYEKLQVKNRVQLLQKAKELM